MDNSIAWRTIGSACRREPRLYPKWGFPDDKVGLAVAPKVNEVNAPHQLTRMLRQLAAGHRHWFTWRSPHFFVFA